MKAKETVQKSMEKLTDLHGESYPRLKRILTPVLAVVYVGFFVSLYLSLVTIDEGTESMYRALDAIFYVFCGLLVPAFAATAFWIAVHVLRKKEYYRHFRKSKLNRRIRTFDVILFILMALFCLMCLYPIIYVLAGSFNQGSDYTRGGVYFLPRIFTFENYRIVLSDGQMWWSYFVTIGRTVIGSATALVFTAAVAYAMSRPNLKFKPFFYWVNIFTMFFSGGLIPYFLVIKTFGLFDSFLVYIIPSLYSVYNMIVLQSGFKSLDGEIHDAAVVDGAGEFRIWWQIYMPLSKPVLATILLWLAVGHWNSYFDTMLYTDNEKLQTLQYFLLKTIQTSSSTNNLPGEIAERLNAKTVSLAAIIVSIIPVLCFFPLVRKNFASGIMIGSLKG